MHFGSKKMPRATGTQMTRKPKLPSSVCNGAIAAPDVLERIFRLCIHQPTEQERTFASGEDRALTRSSTPFTLLRVCRHWYGIVMASPFVWSTITIVLRRARYADVARSLPLLDAHMRRSQNLPLTIVACISIGTFIPVRGMPHDKRDPAVPLYRLLLTLMRNQRRWQDVVLNIQANANAPSGEVYEPLPMDFTLRFRDMQMLKRLSVRYFSRPEYQGMQSCELADCPRLEYLQLVGIPKFCLRGPQSKCLFPRLRTIVCKPDDSEAYAQLRSMLPCAKAVEHLQITFYKEPHDTGNYEFIPIELPNLKNLSLKMDFLDTAQVFDRNSFPSLAKLEMDSVVLQEVDIIYLASHLHKFPLTHLKIDFEIEEVPFDPNVFLQFLQSVSGLRHLQLSKAKFDGDMGHSTLVNMLNLAFGPAHRNPGSMILPRLSHLELRLETEIRRRAKVLPAGVRELVAALFQCYPNGFHFVLWADVEDRNICGKDIREALQVFASPNFKITIDNHSLRNYNAMILG